MMAWDGAPGAAFNRYSETRYCDLDDSHIIGVGPFASM